MSKFDPSKIEPLCESEARSIHFKLVLENGETGPVKGFQLYGLGKTESECYALSFLNAQQLGKAKIDYKDGEIIFTHGGVNVGEGEDFLGFMWMHEGGIYKSPLAEKCWLEINKMFSGEYEGKKCGVRYQMAFSKGFYFGTME